MKAVLLILLVVGASVANAACGYGNVDLSGLKTTTDYTGKDAEYTYKMNVCGLANAGDCGSSICQYNAQGAKVAALGNYDANPAPTWSLIDATDASKGVKASFTNGDQCWMGTPQTRYVDVQFPCDNDQTQFTIVEDPQCHFTIRLPTKKACPGGGGGGGSGSSGGISGGTVFLIILLVGGFLYILLGCVYKTKKLGTSGKESCPNYDFWKEIPGYVKDGFRFTFSGCKRGGSYNQL